MFIDLQLQQLHFIATIFYVSYYGHSKFGLLVLILCLDACEEPFVEVDGGCYFCNPELFTQSYDSASEFCQGMGSYLAVVKSGEENRGIIDVLLTPNGKCSHGL